MRRRFLVGLSLVTPVASTLGFEARDLFAVSAGPVVLHPRFSFSTAYDDNIYFLPSDYPKDEFRFPRSRDDFLYTISPGLNARLGRLGGDNQIEFNYQFQQLVYAENDQSDSSNHSFDLSATVRGSRLSYDCNNSLQILNSILSGYRATVEGIPLEAGNVERNYVDLNHNFDYSLGAKTHILLEGTYRLRDYPVNQILSRTYYNQEEWRATTGFGYNLRPKIRLAGRLYYGQIERSPNVDRNAAGEPIPDPPRADYVGGTIGANGNFTPKLSGDVRVGYEHRWFSDEGGDDGYPVARVGLTERFTEKTSLSISYNRSGGVSATRGTQTANVTISDSADLHFQQVVGLRRPVVLSVNFRYVQTDYSRSSVSLEHLDVQAGASYRLQPWAALFANYTYQFGTRTAYDYTVNVVSLGVNFGY